MGKKKCTIVSKLDSTSCNINNQPLKIAMIGQKHIPSREGGVEVVVEELSAMLVDYGIRVCAYNRRGHHISGVQYDRNIHLKLREYRGIEIKSVFTIEKKGIAALTSSVFATFKALFGHYDVIHFHAEGPSAMLWLPHLFGVKTVVTIHGLDWKRAKWGGLASVYLKFGEKIAAKYADEIIVLSKNIQRYFNEEYHRITEYIPNGISKPTIKDDNIIKKKWGLSDNQYFLYLGRIVPEKGLELLINAYLNTSLPKKLVIAGGASDTDTYLKKIRDIAERDERVLFTGFVEGEELEELFSNAYVYVLPTDLEGMPLSLLEAMSYGNCCLVSDIPECTEVIEDKGISFRRGDMIDLKEKLEWLDRHKDVVMEYKRSARDFICNKYSWEQSAQKTIEVYRMCKKEQMGVH